MLDEDRAGRKLIASPINVSGTPQSTALPPRAPLSLHAAWDSRRADRRAGSDAENNRARPYDERRFPRSAGLINSHR